MDEPSTGKDPRLFIFGWDAADWAVVEEGWRRGKLPTLKSIADQGQCGTLLSTIPPVTPSAWTGFLTGVDPGEHGVFNFRTVRHSDHRILPTNGGSRRVPTLMRGLDAAGVRTCLVTVPWTYPAERLEHGVVVPGWDDPGEAFDTTWPARAGELLEANVARIPRRAVHHGETGPHLRGLAEEVALREKICDLLMDAFDPRLFMVVYVEPDRAGHHLWTEGAVPSTLVDAYELVDAAMGRFMNRWVGDGDVVMVASDHGTRPMHSVVQIGPLLEEGGWLSAADNNNAAPRLAKTLRRFVWSRIPLRLRNRIWRNLPSDLGKKASRSARRVLIDWEKTSAFPLGNADGVGVWINAAPPFADGAVDAADYHKVRDEVIRYLIGITDPDSGERVFTRVAPREEVYAGSAMNGAPDIVLVPKEGYGASQGRGVSESVARVAIGGHRPEGIFLVTRDLGLASTVRIEDLLPAVLSKLGFPSINGDGGPNELAAQPETEVGYSERDVEEMEEHLRDLGYID